MPTRSWCKPPVSRRTLLALAILAVTGTTALGAAAYQAASAPPAADSLIDAAAKAESALQIDAAAARLYQLVIEQPRAASIAPARLQLARVLGVANDLPAALLQCQAVRDGLPPNHALRLGALNLATTLARRFRAPAAWFATTDALPVKGLASFDEPSGIDVGLGGEYVVTDAGSGRASRIAADTAAAVSGMQEITAAAFLPDGSLAVAGKTGITIEGAPITFAATWGGKPRQLRKVRAMAATGAGDLVVIEKDFDGVLRCQRAAASCAPWGPPGKARTVKAGAAGLVYVLDEGQKTVRVLDSGGRQIAVIGPTIGAAKIGEIVDIAVDAAHGLYLLDKETRRVEVFTLRGGAGAPPAFVPAGFLALRPDMPKNPSAIGVAPDGALILAGRSEAKLWRAQ